MFSGTADAYWHCGNQEAGFFHVWWRWKKVVIFWEMIHIIENSKKHVGFAMPNLDFFIE